MDKKDIVEVLERIGTMMEIKGENPFKIRAYSAGARTLQTMEEDLGEVIEAGRLGDIPGIGKALTEKIETLYTTGGLEFYDKLVASVPSGLMDLLDIPGLGGKKIKVLHEKLEVDSIESLTVACQEGKVAELKGFGKKTEEKILSGIKNREAYAARHLWWDARSVVEKILPGLEGLPEVERVEAAGSFRRGMETVGDLDFLVASSNPAPIMDWFTSMEGIAEVTAHGDTKSSIRLEGGMQADLRVVPSEQFYFALHHFTGSKDHNVRMRQKALSIGLSLSEWGLRPEEEKDSSRKAGPVEANSEEDIFKALGLQYVPPSLREGMGEVEAAERNELPELLEFSTLKVAFITIPPRRMDEILSKKWRRKPIGVDGNTSGYPIIRRRVSRPMVWTKNDFQNKCRRSGRLIRAENFGYTYLLDPKWIFCPEGNWILKIQIWIPSIMWLLRCMPGSLRMKRR
jgi:DNA polymerase (family 10)